MQESDALEVFSFIIGFFIGAVLEILIVQLPKNEPIKNYFQSSKKFSLQFFIVALSSAIITMALFYKFGFEFDFYVTALLMYTLIVLAFIDLRYKAVPDYLLLLLLVLVFCVGYNDFLNTLKNALLFAGAFALLEFVLTFYIQNIKAKFLNDESLREAKSLGEGDIPVVAVIGGLLGLKAGLVAIFLAALFAIIPSLYNSIKKKENETPFIPYLLLGLVVEYFFNLSKVFN